MKSVPAPEKLFEMLSEAADTNNWCMRYPCTTCATQDPRSEIVRWLLLDEDSLLTQLESRPSCQPTNTQAWARLHTIAAHQARCIQDMSWDRFTRIFVKHIPPGGSIVLRELGAEPFTDAAKALRQYRKRHTRPYDRLVTKWAARLGRTPMDIRHADRILFYEIRHVPQASLARQVWIAKCIELALESNDVSLHESLIYTLGSELKERAELLASCRGLLAEPKIQDAMRFVGAS